MRELQVVVYGKPRGKAEDRAFAKGEKTWTYKPANQRRAENSFISQIYVQLPDDFELFKCAVEITVHGFISRAKGHYGTGRNSGTLKPSAPRYPTIKPDVDNILKHAFDCFKSIVLDDDKYVVRANVRKDYTDERPRTVIYIRELE